MVRIEDRFLGLKLASSLRACLDSRFERVERAHTDRMVWDYWCVPGQYQLLRTRPDFLFGAALWQRFLGQLGQWTFRNLGFHAVSEPWLSAYVDGCYQTMHSDRPHGPLAFVYSLTRGHGRGGLSFTGGETEILKPEVTSAWGYRSLREGDSHWSRYALRVAPVFNRLVLFDPRIPHRVVPVSGVKDFLASRFVIHGWLADPVIGVEGNVPTQLLREFEQEAHAFVRPEGGYERGASSWINYEIVLSENGKVRQLRKKCSLVPEGVFRLRPQLTGQIRKLELFLKGSEFGPARGQEKRRVIHLPVQVP